jgi:adenine-specific DNA-methyltransferase
MKNVGTRRLEPVAVSQSARTFTPWLEYRSLLLAAADHWASEKPSTNEDREAFAQAICAEVVKSFWDLSTEKDRRWYDHWKPRKASLSLRVRRLAREAAGALGPFSAIEASYLVGTLYTALLPNRLRAARGAYYTPPVLAERLLDLAAAEGIDWSSATALDPACGGGAFLAPLANRILNDHRIHSLPPEDRLAQVERRLTGIEIDPFAAWLSSVFLQLLAYPVSCAAGRSLNVQVTKADALELVEEDARRFDLIIGNPPYGRVRLSETQRELFARSLYGHANLYGVFLDAALRWRSEDGLIAFLTPTSFLGGQYFSRLRDLLLQKAPPLVVDVVKARTGVFESVQQETCLTVFGPNPSKTTVVHLVETKDRTLTVLRAGTFSLPMTSATPWLFPRTPSQSSLVRRASEMRTRLHHVGYKASTGPLVWNRHKSQLKSQHARATYPLVWAEAVRPNEFNFEYRLRASTPFVFVRQDQEHLVCSKASVLVQRTTAKEQQRRLIACAVPEEFVVRWGGIVVENHVNVLRPVDPKAIKAKALAAVLNTKTIDDVFRCLSGSVAVSSTELHSLPLPDLGVFREVEKAVGKDPELGAHTHEFVERVVADAYGG